MEKLELINRLRNETSFVEFYNLKSEILRYLTESVDNTSGD